MYIYGASGQARAVIDILEVYDKVHGVFDDNPEIKEILGYPVLPEIPKEFTYDQPFFIAIGENRVRRDISQRLKEMAEFSSVIHPSAIVSARAKFEEGTVLMEGAIVKVNSWIGRQVIINTGATVVHDCRICDFVHLAPQATVCGGVSIGEGSLVGANSTVLPGIRIGEWCTIGAGSVVTKNVPDGATWLGNGLRK